MLRVAEWLFCCRQESVYLSLQSHLVTLQVLPASPLLQEFTPHLLHLSSRVQTLSLPRSHTVWWLLLSDAAETAAALSDSKHQTKQELVLKGLQLIGDCCRVDFPVWLHFTFWLLCKLSAGGRRGLRCVSFKSNLCRQKSNYYRNSLAFQVLNAFY